MAENEYFELIEALKKNGQTECKSLWMGAMDNKIVRFQTTYTNLGDILTLFNSSKPETIEKLDYDLLKKEIPVLVNNCIPPTPRYYIPRVISRSRRISRDIFNRPGKDIFVVIGLHRDELITLANGMNTDVSTNQTKNLTVQFILLENDSHFDKICSKTINPVHLIEYSADKHFNRVKTNGSAEKILKFVQDEEMQMSEEEFMQECLKSKRPVCIADSSGAGTSFLLTRMAEMIMEQNSLQLVRFLQLSDFLVKLKQPVTQDSLCTAIAELSSDFKTGRELVSNSLQSEEIASYLFFDGVDEVSPDQVPIVRDILICASKLEKTRVYAAASLHMRRELEDIFGDIGFTMLPFGKEEQIDFLVKFWQDKVGGSTERLKDFASACLESLKSVIGDQNIAGIPLLCSIIAGIYQNDAEKYSTSEATKLTQLRAFSSIFEMYQDFMNDGFRKLGNENAWRWWSIRKQTLESKMKTNLMNLSVVQLYPERRGGLPSFRAKMSDDVSTKEGPLFLPGIDSPSVRLVHGSFARYLVAEFIAVGPPQPLHNLDIWDAGAGLVMLFLLFWFGPGMFLAALTGFCFGKQNKDKCEFIHADIRKLLAKDVLATKTKTHSIQLRLGGEVSLKSYEFVQPTICYFLDGFLQQQRKNTVSLLELKSTEQKEDFAKMYTAAVVNNHSAIGNWLVGMFESECENLPWPELLLLAAKYADIEMMKQLIELICKISRKRPVDLSYSDVNGIPITPLNVAAQRGAYNLFEYLWNKAGFREAFMEEHKNVRCLLHECVVGTFLETEEVVQNKLQIVNLILSDDKCTMNLQTILEERLPQDGSTPLLQSHIHLNLFKCLISKGAQVTQSNRREHALHIAATNGNLPVVEFLIKNHSAFVQVLDSEGNNPLHLAALDRTNQHVDIQLKLINAGADIYTDNEKGCNPFMNGMKHGNGLDLRIIKAIKRRHPQFLSAFVGQGLKSLLTNSNLMVSEWDESLIAVAKYLIREGAIVRCRKIESPWGLEQVESNMREISGTIDITGRFVKRLKYFGILNKNTEISDKQNLLKILKEAQGSYEKLILSLMKCKQMKQFLIMKQCLQSDDNDSLWFLTPPPGMLDFIVDQKSRVFILQSYNSECTTVRIRDTLYPAVVVKDFGDLSEERGSGLNVINCPSRTKLNEMLPQLLSFGPKTICIVNEAVTLSQLDDNDAKLVRTAYDEVKWDDLSEKVRVKLTFPFVECEEKLKNCTSFFNIVLSVVSLFEG